MRVHTLTDVTPTLIPLNIRDDLMAHREIKMNAKPIIRMFGKQTQIQNPSVSDPPDLGLIIHTP